MGVEAFNRNSSLIIVPVTVKVDDVIKDFRFVIDTGSTITMIDSNVMKKIGYTEANSIRTSHTLTASKTETVCEYSINNIRAVGLTRRNFKVISRSLPAALGIDGLLGLNFFKNRELTIDFKLSQIRIR